MTPRDDPEPKQAELLWNYIEELKRSDSPESVQFVAVTRGECPEVVGLMETAAEAFSVVKADSAPHCSREAIRQRLQAVIAGADTSAASQEAVPQARRAAPSMWLPAWLLTPLSGRSTGWAVAVAALVALIWTGTPRSHDPSVRPAIAQLNHSETLDLVPQLIAGTLDIDKERAAWGHFNGCDHCFQIFEEKRQAVRAKRGQTSRTGVHGSGGTITWSAAPLLWRLGPVPAWLAVVREPGAHAGSR